jgi:hypothetical protein
MRETDKFFAGEKIDLSLVGIKAKPKENKIWTIRLALSSPLTAKVLADSPQNVVEAFNAIAKDDMGLNPIGLTAEFDEAVFTFYATQQTKSPSLEVGGCVIRDMQVERPDKKAVLDDGDVKLRFNLDIPASREVWDWAYRNYGATLCAEIESVQMKLNIKAADPEGKNGGQGILEMGKTDAQPTTVDNKSKAAGEKDEGEPVAAGGAKKKATKKKAPAKKKK